jgi:hypothetical protein
LISHCKRRLDRSDRARVELHRRLDGVVNPSLRDEGSNQRRDRGDLTHQVAGQVDDVRGEIPDRSRAGLLGIEAPAVARGVVAPVLQVAGPEVTDLAQLAGLDQLARQAHGRYEARVEAAHVLDAGLRHRAPELVALVRRARQRLLAKDVLARLGGQRRRLGVKGVRAAVVEQADLLVEYEVVPVGRPALVAVAACGRLDLALRAPGDRDQARHERRRPGHARNLAEGVRVRLAHERVAEHPDADYLRRLGRFLSALLLVHVLRLCLWKERE